MRTPTRRSPVERTRLKVVPGNRRFGARRYTGNEKESPGAAPRALGDQMKERLVA